eukprot:3840130-Amphidinium_carterae.1
MWSTSPKKIYKWIRGTAAVWDLAILSSDGFALSPDQATKAELEAWSKLWQPGRTTFPAKATSRSPGSPEICNPSFGIALWAKLEEWIDGALLSSGCFLQLLSPT